jgi:hypothetical protein
MSTFRQDHAVDTANGDPAGAIPPAVDRLYGFTIGVAVAAHHDDAHLARTLDAADEALAEAGVVPAARVLVSAEGSPAAEKLAAQRGWSYRRILAGSPRTRAAAREAARRGAGGAATIVLDGDVALQPGFVRAALALLAEREGIAGVGGRVDEAHWRRGALVGGRRDVDATGGGGAARRLRDVALWRREAVDAVGGYDPWVPSHDDEELAGRLRMAGYALVTLDATAGVRHGTARDSSGDFAERMEGGEMNGPGLVLRRARGTMAFGEHLRTYAGRIVLLLWMVVGGAAAILGREAGLGFVWAWATAGLLAFFAVLRRGPVRAFWQGMIALAEGLGIVRNLVAPIALPRVGPPPRPIAPPAPAGETEAAQSRRARDAAPPEGDPDDPPPIVRRG